MFPPPWAQPDVHLYGFGLVANLDADERHPDRVYLSALLPGQPTQVNHSGAAALKAFSDFVATKYERNNPNRGSRTVYGSSAQAQTAMHNSIHNAAKAIDTGWTWGGSGAQPPATTDRH